MPREKGARYPSREWISVKSLKPKIFYELVWVKDSTERISTAWWTGSSWDGGNKVDFNDIEYWKPLY